MPLPTVSLPTSEVELPDGQTVHVRGLSRGEFVSLLSMDEYSEQEVATLAYGTDTPMDDAKEWYRTAPPAVVVAIIDAVTTLSGMAEDSGKE